jgi:carbamoyltransferase
MYILGVSCYYHDAAAALLHDGQLIAAAEEERLSRIKHDNRFPRNAIRFCLDRGGIQSSEIAYVVFFEKPFRKLDRILMSTLQASPRSCALFRESVISWMTDKLWLTSKLTSELGIPRGRILFSEHHLSHAASAFLCSPFDEAAILTVDGVGEWVTATYGVGRGNQISPLKQIEFPHSIGLLYSAFTAFLGFEVNEGEYKVMGMAAYGKPQYADKVWKLVRGNSDGSFSLDLSYFSFHHSTHQTYNDRFVALFGEPRLANSGFFTEQRRSTSHLGAAAPDRARLSERNQYYADLAASIQSVTEELLLNMANNLYRETRLNRLCFAGGVALNSLANSRLLKDTPFEELYIQPSAGDGGGALGAALWAYYSLFNNRRQFVMEHAYWGCSYTESEISEFLRIKGFRFRQVNDYEVLVDEVVDNLIRSKVVGWFQGRFEWGPRALGNRSILADPCNPEIKNIINTKIKFREPFRPFAPSVLADRAESYFELPNACGHFPARYMLCVVPVRKSRRNTLPAITHVDGTARPQLVFQEQNPLYHRLIERFGQATGVPIVLNTSFNLQGEPIVGSPADALQTFVKSKMDILVMGNFLVDRAAT